MALVSVSPRAWEAMERRTHKAGTWVYDLLRWREFWIPVSRGGKIPDGAPRRQPISIPTHLTLAMRAAVDLILEEGLPNRFQRHAAAGRAFRAGLDAVVKQMRDRYGILIGTGLDRFRSSTLRVGHMGITANPLYVLPTLSALELALRDLGYKSEAGAAVAAAQSIFAIADGA
jgi:aspartate aminotransferase-like enzyme